MATMPIPIGTFYRTCQECGHKQVAKRPPAKELSYSYTNTKCAKCKSESLDYGTEMVDPDYDWSE